MELKPNYKNFEENARKEAEESLKNEIITQISDIGTTTIPKEIRLLFGIDEESLKSKSILHLVTWKMQDSELRIKLSKEESK